ncbi:MBL fold metallo-hydrolase [Rhodovulum steppense]|uniref:Glyoxylase-like metal-dependent hydrolase (Beta-lactamase superfamily II) n=1 Tax=Rhodovulum steppense TaxID=540251 RepID=A0A4R1YKS3_9RHOB|nr:MBL fold metallo-hydrolase [Rhodovulum steppense]TCM77615.1 glyoxylase-like metal-dependent hydrolase (beta-lactamase superfamily II) [Rhodovulum steppense]
MTETRLSRRQALMAGAALPLAAATAGTARAAAPMLGAAMPQFHRFTLGGFEVTTLLAGTRTVEDPQTIFGMNASPEEFAEVSAANRIPTDKAQFFFTPTVVNTGSELVLFDTGLNPEGITGVLAAAGYSADQIDKVVITHMHGDHIGGLSGEAGETFGNAAYYTGQVEFDAWEMSGDETFEARVRPLAEKMTFLDDGGAVASGVTAMAAFGHTPGHMAYMLESDGRQMVIAADFANHYVWSLGYPDWEVRFDRDKKAAAATRRRMLGMMAADGVPFIGYHMPFPGFGFVEARGEGFRYVPASYQMMLG